MKKTLLIAFVLLAVLAHAQAPPQGINYQAVARNNNGSVIANSTLASVRFSIYSGTPNGTLEYRETHANASTNGFGLFTLVIGQGTQTGGAQPNFAGIPWGSITAYIKVEVDNGTGYIDMGTTQFWSVPYALYAASSGSGG